MIRALGVLRRLLMAICRRTRQPISARHIELSLLSSMDDSLSMPSERLIDASMKAIEEARRTSLEQISERIGNALPAKYTDVWPGEHYRLLAGLAKVLKPKLIIEIGTAEGLSALAFAEAMGPECRVVTFDLIPWREYSQTFFRPDDFNAGRIVQEIADLSDSAVFARYRSLLSEADLIFIDGPKDGRFEDLFVERLEETQLHALCVFDDIRLWNMLHLWRELRWPKLDITSFGHWSGTGLALPPALPNGLVYPNR